MDWNYLLTNYEGRINRQPFWMGMLALFVVNIAVSLVSNFLFGDGFIGLIVQVIIAIGMLYLSFAVLVKRCHDRGKSGWWSLITIIPVVGLIWAIIDLGILEGTQGDNEFGEDPLR